MARELAPAGLRSGPYLLGLNRIATAAQSSGSKLPRHKSRPVQARCPASIPPALICPKTPCLLVSRRFNSQPE
nr:hypothetical protein C1892_15655 [Pseudomonas sp. MPBD7-1]